MRFCCPSRHWQAMAVTWLPWSAKRACVWWYLPKTPHSSRGRCNSMWAPWIHRQMETLIFSPPPPLYSPRRSHSSCPGEHMCCFKEEVHNRIQRPVLEIWLRAFLLFSQTFFFSGQGWIYCRCSTQQAVTTSWWPVTTLKLKYMQA